MKKAQIGKILFFFIVISIAASLFLSSCSEVVIYSPDDGNNNSDTNSSLSDTLNKDDKEPTEDGKEPSGEEKNPENNEKLPEVDKDSENKAPEDNKTESPENNEGSLGGETSENNKNEDTESNPPITDENPDGTVDSESGYEGEVDNTLPSIPPEEVPGGVPSVPPSEGACDSVFTASMKGLKSAVSVYCYFKTTYYQSFWNPTPVTQEYYSMGSGVFYDIKEDGSAFIITNYHVVYDADSNTTNKVSDNIKIFLYGLEVEEYAVGATFVGGSAKYDIAVLRVDSNEIVKKSYEKGTIKEADIADSDSVLPGQAVLAIGNPSTSTISGISVTAGVVSVESESIVMSAVDGSGNVEFRVIRTDTAVNAGNSGGGLFNSKGELVGIVNAKSNLSSIENIAYAIPSDVVLAAANNIIDYCNDTECEKPWRAELGLDVGIVEMSVDYNENLGALVRSETVMIGEVIEGGAAENKLQAEDIIKEIKIGEKVISVTRIYHYKDALLDMRVGDTVVFTVLREGKTVEVEIAITEADIVEC